MHSYRVARLRFLLLSVLFASLCWPQAPDSPDETLAATRKLFRQGDFHATVAALERRIADHPVPDLYALLVQSFLKLDDVKSAEESSRKALEAFPQSALTHAARGDVYFRRGLIFEAQSEYQSALKIDETCARAWLGRGKVDAALAKRLQAKDAVSRAHELDAGDGDALYEWAIRQPYPENVAALEKHLSEFRFDPELEGHERDYAELLKALAGKPVWILSPEVSRSELKLEYMPVGPGLGTRGYALRVRFNDHADALLLLDTGASGVTITRKFAEKVGARKLSDTAIAGIGKTRMTRGYQAWVDKITIGGLAFHDCFVHVTPSAVTELDGVIGADVFVKFLVTVDFRARKLRLDPLPAPSASDDGAGQGGPFSQAFAFGHFLLLQTRAADKVAGLFVVDSGSNLTTISPEPAQRLRQLRPLNAMVMGMSGGVNSGFIADDVTLEFGNMRRQNQRIITVDLHSVSKNLGTELSGQIGFNTLEDMRMVINYRDGLVKFEASK